MVLDLVGVAGFEPTASCSQSRRATNCATPRIFHMIIVYQNLAPVSNRRGDFFTPPGDCLKLNFCPDILCKRFDLDALLRHRVTVADSHTAIRLGIKVIGDAERGTDLVLTAVPFSDRACVVIIDHKLFGEGFINFARALVQLFGEGQHTGLERGECRMQTHDDPDILLALVVGADNLFIISVTKEGQRDTVGAERRPRS